jgi:hypothetical protein
MRKAKPGQAPARERKLAGAFDLSSRNFIGWISDFDPSIIYWRSFGIYWRSFGDQSVTV